jgi:hypothetical protein
MIGRIRMVFVNLTPHDITIIREGKESLNIKASGTVARAEQRREQVGTVDGVPVNHVVYGKTIGLPAPQDGVAYIVSSLTAQAVKATEPSRRDVYITDDAVRDTDGHIIGCRALAQV